MAKRMVAQMLRNAGVSEQTISDTTGDPTLARRFRDQVLSSLRDQDLLGELDGERLLTIHAYNPQLAGLFYENERTCSPCRS